MISKLTVTKSLSIFMISLMVTGYYVLPVQADETKTVQSADENQKAEDDDNDPFETLNRFTSGFNRIVRGAILDPLVDGYQAVTPDSIQEAIGNAASNLSEPVTAISSLLEGDTENAGNATKRFIVNTTAGFGGTQDKASEMGIEQRREDLGQAAASHGAESGPYIVLPLLGPSNTRDALGTAVTAVASPMPLVGALTSSGVEYSRNQDELQAITKGALDPYTVEKNAYRQHRKYVIKNGEVAEEEPDFPAFDEKLE